MCSYLYFLSSRTFKTPKILEENHLFRFFLSSTLWTSTSLMALICGESSDGLCGGNSFHNMHETKGWGLHATGFVVDKADGSFLGCWYYLGCHDSEAPTCSLPCLEICNNTREAWWRWGPSAGLGSVPPRGPLCLSLSALLLGGLYTQVRQYDVVLFT